MRGAEMDSTAKSAIKKAKCLWAVIFGLGMLVTLPFVIVLGLKMTEVENDPFFPSCVAPSGEGSMNVIDQSLRIKMALKFGFWALLVIAINQFCIGFAPLPFDVGTAACLGCCGVCLFMFTACLSTAWFILAPVYIFSYPGKYCSGKLVEGVDDLQDVTEWLKKVWIAYIVTVNIANCIIYCVMQVAIKAIKALAGN